MRDGSVINNEFMVWCPVLGESGGYIKVVEDAKLYLYVEKGQVNGVPVYQRITREEFNSWTKTKDEENALV